MKQKIEQKATLKRYLVPGLSLIGVLLITGLVIIFSSQSEDTHAITSSHPSSGVINAFAKVTSINGTTINLDNVNESFASFEANEKVIIMQMQDSVIGSNTSNDSTFGSIESINSAGLYEVFTIASVTETSGVPSSIVLQSAPTVNFNFTENSSVQLISFPTLGDSTGFTTTADITTIDWDGNVGGVLCFNVDGDLTLDHNIIADAAGFKGGIADKNNSSSNCKYDTYIIGSNGEYAAKGEGIYKSVDPNYELGIGHVANGAGGGSSHNAGGGGGSNYSEGGQGGAGWKCTKFSGGRSGVALDSYITPKRIFMGGGGGSGEGNNKFAGGGGNGGGIILINANTIETTGSGSGVRISANGEDGYSTTSAGNDGAGGAGAGGSIVLFVDAFNVSANKTLTIAADGGTGGSVTHNHAHGAGGGGGLGSIIFTIPKPTSVTIENIAGTGGSEKSGAQPDPDCLAAGAPDDGVIVDPLSPGISLPIELMYFTAKFCGDAVCLEWKTASETNNDFYTIEKSYNAVDFEIVTIQKGAGNSVTEQSYLVEDRNIESGVIYYRLKQTDFDGMFEIFPMVSVDISGSDANDFAITKAYPNPFKNFINVEFNADAYGNVVVGVYNANGQLVSSKTHYANEGMNTVKVDLESDLPSGYYFCDIRSDNKKTKSFKLVKR